MMQMFRRQEVERVVDLGCGVGGTMHYMSRRYAARFYGVTLSPLQTELGTRILADTDCMIMTGDMTDDGVLSRIAGESPAKRAFICIEAYLHLSPSSSFLARLARVASSGDLFIIQDDFLRGSPEHPDVVDFKTGWHAVNLDTAEALLEDASSAGFRLVEDADLTPFLGPKKMTNLMIGALVTVLRPFKPRGSWWDNFLGGNALQKCLAGDLITYRQISFIKV
jgi:cyclopropane fatty-acyl-phospholipid synthase-like methyltransferase